MNLDLGYANAKRMDDTRVHRCVQRRIYRRLKKRPFAIRRVWLKCLDIVAEYGCAKHHLPTVNNMLDDIGWPECAANTRNAQMCACESENRGAGHIDYDDS